jgi:thiol-disulfide isomerase/thioredoxin
MEGAGAMAKGGGMKMGDCGPKSKIVSALVLVMMAIPAVALAEPPQKGGQLPLIMLPVPKSPEERAYLGLSGTGTFKIPQIKADVVIVEIFSMYCPICQKDAPGLNELYNKIQEDPDLRNRIKMVGIGAGNSAFEVETYKKTYGVLFPLFPDPDYAIHQACGDVRTPCLVVVKIEKDKSHRIFLSQQGGFPGAQPFLEQILRESGLR